MEKVLKTKIETLLKKEDNTFYEKSVAPLLARFNVQEKHRIVSADVRSIAEALLGIDGDVQALNGAEINGKIDELANKVADVITKADEAHQVAEDASEAAGEAVESSTQANNKADEALATANDAKYAAAAAEGKVDKTAADLGDLKAKHDTFEAGVGDPAGLTKDSDGWAANDVVSAVNWLYMNRGTFGDGDGTGNNGNFTLPADYANKGYVDKKVSDITSGYTSADEVLDGKIGNLQGDVSALKGKINYYKESVNPMSSNDPVAQIITTNDNGKSSELEVSTGKAHLQSMNGVNYSKFDLNSGIASIESTANAHINVSSTDGNTGHMDIFPKGNTGYVSMYIDGYVNGKQHSTELTTGLDDSIYKRQYYDDDGNSRISSLEYSDSDNVVLYHQLLEKDNDRSEGKISLGPGSVNIVSRINNTNYNGEVESVGSNVSVVGGNVNVTASSFLWNGKTVATVDDVPSGIKTITDGTKDYTPTNGKFKISAGLGVTTEAQKDCLMIKGLDATQFMSGMMSASDKKKLDGIQVSSLTVEGGNLVINGNKYVLTPVDTSAENQIISTYYENPVITLNFIEIPAEGIQNQPAAYTYYQNYVKVGTVKTETTKISTGGSLTWSFVGSVFGANSSEGNVSVPANRTTERRAVGTLMLKVDMNGKSAEKSITIYQAGAEPEVDHSNEVWYGSLGDNTGSLGLSAARALAEQETPDTLKEKLTSTTSKAFSSKWNKTGYFIMVSAGTATNIVLDSVTAIGTTTYSIENGKLRKSANSTEEYDIYYAVFTQASESNASTANITIS